MRARCGLGTRQAMHFADELQNFAAAQIVIENRTVGQVTDVAFDLGAVALAVEAGDPHRTTARHQDAHHHADRGGFSGAVGPKENQTFRLWEPSESRARARGKRRRSSTALRIRSFAFPGTGYWDWPHGGIA